MAIPYSSWISLPLSTRVKIAEAFGFLKLRSTHVADNQVVDDGYILQDVENALKVASLQNYLKSTETDVTKLFQTLVDKMEGRETPPIVIPEEVVYSEYEAYEAVEQPVKKVKKVVKKKK